ncbi:MAG: polyprenyl synthetase family protein [Candidatus Andersenbacteria bacterium]|nr:polyprenyl synthetase family protein [Candidatus Andersenbacteria bacterium]
MLSLEQYRLARGKEIDNHLEKLLPSEDVKPELFHKAMRYSLFSGGKRLRPLLCLAGAEAVADNFAAALTPACAIEAMHTYSLVHDDLPALDDDAERRGKPSSHVVFGEAQAILAGDGLLTISFEWMATSKPVAPYTGADLCLELAQAGGAQGIVGGQVEDVLAEGKAPQEDTLLFIDRLKTVAIIRAAMRIGAMCGGASPGQLKALTKFAEHFGLARQFIDDIEDAMEGEDSSDIRLQKMTAVTVYGLDGAKERARQGMNDARKALEEVELREQGKHIFIEVANLFLSRL